MEDRIIRTCSLLALSAAAALLIVPSPAAALVRVDPARVYLEARAAAIEGRHARSAVLLAQLVDTSAASPTVAREAVSQAIRAGDMKLALRLAKGVPAVSMPMEARLLQVAEAVRGNDPAKALALLQGAPDAGNPDFLKPFIAAWGAADAGDQARALAELDQVTPRNLLAALGPEHRALILLKFGRIAEAQPFIDQALKVSAGGRDRRLRLAFADAYLALGDRNRALAIVGDEGSETRRDRERIAQGKALYRIDNGRRAFSEVLVVLAAEVNRLHNESLPVPFAQVARYAAPENSAAAILLGLMLDRDERTNDALAALRSVPANDPLAPQARDAEVRVLVGADRDDEALQAAQRAIAGGLNDVSDYARLGDVYAAMKRSNEAAAAYGRALQLAGQARGDDRWPLLLLQASALEEGNRWPEARQALTQALALAPNEPLILNFLGYAKLERGEDLDAAEALIRKASSLAPDDASITDSLGWALYKRGRLKEAIEVLTRAAKADPAQAEIREHLGDALYKAGNRFEARYAWQAALVTAEGDIATRIKAKLESGLTAATAAP